MAFENQLQPPPRPILPTILYSLLGIVLVAAFVYVLVVYVGPKFESLGVKTTQITATLEPSPSVVSIQSAPVSSPVPPAAVLSTPVPSNTPIMVKGGNLPKTGPEADVFLSLAAGLVLGVGIFSYKNKRAYLRAVKHIDLIS